MPNAGGVMRAQSILAALCLLAVTGCSDSKFIANSMVKTGTMEDMNKAFFMEDSPAHAGAAAPGLLMLMDGFIVATPENEDLLLQGATLNCGYAMAFLDYSDLVWAASIYKKGRGYALRAAREELPDLADALASNDLAAIRAELKEVDEDDLALIYWLGMCWGGRINATKSIEDVADLPIVEAVMERALEIDETYFFAGGHLLFGMMYAGRTEKVGGDPARGKVHYERGIELTEGRFLLAKVHYAMNYATNVQDVALYVRLLEEVLDSEPSEIDDDDNRLTNQVSRDLAQQLMDDLPRRFPDYEPGGDDDDYGDDEPIEDLDLD